MTAVSEATRSITPAGLTASSGAGAAGSTTYTPVPASHAPRRVASTHPDQAMIIRACESLR